MSSVFFFQAEDGIRDVAVTGVQTCALPILSKARNSIRLVLDHSHLWSSRIRGVREILAHPGKKPMGHRRRSEFGGCQSKTAAQNNNEPPCPRRFLTQPTEFEKSGVLQHPLASSGSTNSRSTPVSFLRGTSATGSLCATDWS